MQSYKVIKEGDKLVCPRPIPVLNTPHFKKIFGGEDGNSLLTDHKGHIRALEFVALPNTIFDVVKILNQENHPIYQVKSSKYLSDPLYIDARFTTSSKTHYPSVNPINYSSLTNFLLSKIGLSYVWGGNWSLGLDEMLSFFPPKKKIDTQTKNLWTLKGVDCSGLLYEATSGFTPRNTSDLLTFGSAIKIEKQSVQSIIQNVKPLDLIVFPGHVVIVLDQKTTIESIEGRGVILTSLQMRLENLLEKKVPKNIPSNNNSYFVMRRWLAK